MKLSPFFHRLGEIGIHRRAKRQRQRIDRSNRCRIRVEELEDRTVPTILDLTLAPGAFGTINGAIFTGASGRSVGGQGVIDPFERMDATPVEQGFNTNYSVDKVMNNVDVGGPKSDVHAITVSELPVVVKGGELYYEFSVAINQQGSAPLLSLDKLQISTSTSDTLFNYTTDGTYNNAATLCYDMNASPDGPSEVLLNWSLNGANGVTMFLNVPVSDFAGATGGQYVYLYSQFGAYTGPGGPPKLQPPSWSANDGYETWERGIGVPLEVYATPDTHINEVTPVPTVDVSTVPVGATVQDTSKLILPTGKWPTPTGTVTYYFYDTSTPVLGTTTPVRSWTVTLNPNGTVPDSGITDALAAGSYSFIATYNGDSIFVGTPSAIEPLTVTPATPSITTSQQPATARVGSSIADKATVSGGYNPSGTVTFDLYNNANATGTPLFSDTESLVAGVATSAGYTAVATGTDYWVATYNGDTNNNPVTSGSALEPVTITRASPTIVTNASETAGGLVGSAVLSDTATLSGGYFPHGTIDFTLTRPDGSTINVGTVTVTGDKTYSAPSTVLATDAGTYTWHATYSGDANNNSATDNGANESLVTSGRPPIPPYFFAPAAAVRPFLPAGPVYPPVPVTYVFNMAPITSVNLFTKGAEEEKLGTISGEVFWDDNGNGILDPGEEGIPNQLVLLVREDLNGQMETVATTWSDSTGWYIFLDVKPGLYHVRTKFTRDWVQTTQADFEGAYVITMRGGYHFVYKNFGAIPTSLGAGLALAPTPAGGDIGTWAVNSIAAHPLTDTDDPTDLFFEEWTHGADVPSWGPPERLHVFAGGSAADKARPIGADDDAWPALVLAGAIAGAGHAWARAETEEEDPELTRKVLARM